MKFKNASRILLRHRNALNLTQKELARRGGVHLQVISNIERGISGIPAMRAKKFAKVLGISTQELAKVAAADFYAHYLKKAKY